MSTTTKSNPAYQDIINELPKPYSSEEQYLYSIACVVAEVPYKLPFQNAFWRKEQYLKAIWQIAIEKVAEPTIPDDNTITSEKIVDGAITEIKLAQEVIDKLLGDDKVTTAMLQDSSITANKIANNAIIAENIAENTIILNNLSKEVTNLLLAVNHVGIIQQSQINKITESGDTLTLDVIKNKVNEIIEVLNKAEITK